MFILLLHEIGHSATYFLCAILLVKLLKLDKYPLKEILLGYMVSLGLDVDHLLDYFIINNWSGFSIKEFLFGNYFLTSNKIYVLLHAWEWAFFLVLLHFILKRKYNFILFAAFGIAAHLIFDTVSYGFNWQAYLFTHRYLNNFDKIVFMAP